MAETAAIVLVLKKRLKLRGVTYQDVAERLNLSEGSVKKMFSENRFSLSRLDHVCEMIDMEISDLLVAVEAERQALHTLTYDQEKELVENNKLLLIAVCVLQRLTYDDILDAYQLSDLECKQYLLRLEKLKLIRLFSDNRIKLLVSRQFSWRVGGPIQAYFRSKLEQEFFSSQFDGENEKFTFLTGMLSKKSNALLVRKIEKLALDFSEYDEEDSSLQNKDKKSCTLIAAIRPWQLSTFKQYSSRVTQSVDE